MLLVLSSVIALFGLLESPCTRVLLGSGYVWRVGIWHGPVGVTRISAFEASCLQDPWIQGAPTVQYSC